MSRLAKQICEPTTANIQRHLQIIITVTVIIIQLLELVHSNALFTNLKN